MNAPVQPNRAKPTPPQPVKIVSVDIPLEEVFMLTFRVVLSLAAMGAVLGVLYALLINFIR